MKILTFAAILSARITTFILRLIGRGGTSLPGRIALLFQKDLLGILSQKYKVIAVTGTNGKTTTSRIIGSLLFEAGLDFFENKSGANLLPGIAASFAMDCSLLGKPGHRYAIIECDEAAFRTAAPKMQPAIVVITNLFRDQLDRYGEISHMLTKIKEGLLSCPDSTVVFNSDDSLSYSISSSIKNSIITFGINESPYGSDDDFISDAPYCIRCKGPYNYVYRTYGHLGDFYCSSCGYRRTPPDISATDIEMNFERSTFTLHLYNETLKVSPSLPGAYNIYNVLAAVAAVSSFINDQTVLSVGISTFESGFGRMERVIINDFSLTMVLVKNPAGLNQVINFLSYDDSMKILVMILNDRFADGTDISWIWDANFEKLFSFSDRFSQIYLSGMRAEELKLRFKYAGYEPNMLHVEKDYKHLMEKIELDNKENLPVFVLPTYTAMFDFRKVIASKFRLKEFWK
ncbi:MAG: DUF1727 domain-containing protein [Clostridia bacterium]|nr:DUF1727 domain-containing protein [Clostridia bacterium]